jgi:glutamine synthetase
MLAPTFLAVGEYLYVPDMASMKICPYAPGEASVMGWFQEKTPVPRADSKLSVEVDLCPRGILKRVVEYVLDSPHYSLQYLSHSSRKARNIHVDFLVGFESEFILLKSTNPVQASNIHSWSATNGIPSGSAEAVALKEIADSIQASGIELQMYHPEAAPGQV